MVCFLSVAQQKIAVVKIHWLVYTGSILHRNGCGVHQGLFVTDYDGSTGKTHQTPAHQIRSEFGFLYLHYVCARLPRLTYQQESRYIFNPP